MRRILAEAERVDAEEHARFGDGRGDKLPARFRDREERLRSRAEKDRRGRRPQPPQPDPGAKVNVTDPDSRVVRDYHGYFQGYNVQAVTSREQIIVAAEVTRAATDMHELQPMIEAMHRNLQAAHCGPPRVLLADAGYYSEANVRQAEGRGPELLLATRSDRNRRAGTAPPRGRIPAGLSVRERMDRKLATQRGPAYRRGRRVARLPRQTRTTPPRLPTGCPFGPPPTPLRATASASAAAAAAGRRSPAPAATRGPRSRRAVLAPPRRGRSRRRQG